MNVAERFQLETARQIHGMRSRVAKELHASLDRPSSFLSIFAYSPEQVRAVEMAWLEQHGDVAMGILHEEALSIEAGHEWQRWEADAITRIEEVFHG